MITSIILLSEIPSEFQKKIVEDFKTQSYDRIWEFIYNTDGRTVYACSSDNWLRLHRWKNTGVWCTSITEEAYKLLLKSGI
jgi:hypothetical protein